MAAEIAAAQASFELITYLGFEFNYLVIYRRAPRLLIIMAYFFKSIICTGSARAAWRECLLDMEASTPGFSG